MELVIVSGNTDGTISLPERLRMLLMIYISTILPIIAFTIGFKVPRPTIIRDKRFVFVVAWVSVDNQ